MNTIYQSRFLAVLLLVFCVGEPSAGFAQTASKKEESPNVILIMTDDQGCGDFSFVGNKTISTPNLDRLASQSAQLTRFYVHPVCTPTRAALMTGRYPQRTGAYDTYIGRAMMSPKEVTIAELLKSNGYSTGIFGKWHLGDCYPMRPSEQGFDESLIHLGGGLAQPSDPIENKRRYTNPILFHSNQKKKIEGYCTDIYFSNAMKFMQQAKENKKPFFTYIATNAPHGPFHDVPEKSLKRYRGKTVDDKTDRIFAMIDNVDENLGRLIEFLDKEKLTDNTIVMFLTDNGPNTQRFVGPFRGRKGQTLEGGIRTVFLAKWPGKFKQGIMDQIAAANIDLFPTIAAAAGAKVPESLNLDGRSILPLLKGRELKNFPKSRPLVFQWHRGEPVRGKSFAVVSDHWKLIGNKPNEKRKLFNIQKDPNESKNVIDQHPEIATKLSGHYRQWYDSLNNGKDYEYVPKPIEIGTEHEKLTSFTKQDWFRTTGKGWGSLGVWHFKLKHTKKFQATVILQRPLKKPTSINLRIGKRIIKGKFSSGSPRFQFPEFELEPSNGTIQVSAEGDQPIPGFYQLHLEQK